MSDDTPLSYDSPFLSPVFYLILSCSFCLVIFLLKVQCLDLFQENFQFFHMALVEQLGDDSWSVVRTACCRMALVFAIMH